MGPRTAAVRTAILLLLAALAGGEAAARTLYACVDTLGRKTLQDRPCAAGQQTERAYSAPKAATRPPAALARPASAAKARAAAARRLKDSAYTCAALSEEKYSVNRTLGAAAAAEEDYWREQLRRIDLALCRSGCASC